MHADRYIDKRTYTYIPIYLFTVVIFQSKRIMKPRGQCMSAPEVVLIDLSKFLAKQIPDASHGHDASPSLITFGR